MFAIGHRPSAISSVLLGAIVLCGNAFAQEDEMGWPREIEDPRARIVMYQPQVDSFVGNELTARTAISVTLTGKTQPVFGAAWLESRVDTDRDDRTVTILETRVPQVRFPDASDEQEKELSNILVEELSGRALTISLDRLLTSLDLAEHERLEAEGFDNDPPKIEFVNYPAILVTIDGQPQLRDIEGQSGLKHVVNSAFMIIVSGPNNYLYAGSGQWYASSQIMGPWKFTQSVPTQVKSLAPVEEEKRGPRSGGSRHGRSRRRARPGLAVATSHPHRHRADGAHRHQRRTRLQTGRE